MAVLDAVIVGAGQAGLGVSYYLKQSGKEHIVYEKGRVGESWKSQRWDSFQVNTPNSFNALPGLPYEGPEPDGFWHTRELTDYFDGYVDHFQLPVQSGVTVSSVEREENAEGFIVKTKADGRAESSVSTRSVVVASGIQRVPKFPSIRSKLPDGILQMHTADYRNPDSLPDGAVVVIGSGQSGCQLTEDLLSAGRTVYLCTSKVGRVRRRYRGKDILEWWKEMKFIDVTYKNLEDKSMARAPQPQFSGLGLYGHTVSLQYL